MLGETGRAGMVGCACVIRSGYDYVHGTDVKIFNHNIFSTVLHVFFFLLLFFFLAANFSSFQKYTFTWEAGVTKNLAFRCSKDGFNHSCDSIRRRHGPPVCLLGFPPAAK